MEVFEASRGGEGGGERGVGGVEGGEGVGGGGGEGGGRAGGGHLAVRWSLLKGKHPSHPSQPT